MTIRINLIFGGFFLLTAFSCAQAEPDIRHQAQHSGVKASLRGVCAVSKDVAWASGSGGTWLRTTDGGQIWESGVVPGFEELDFRDIEAFSGKEAVMLSAGRPAVVLRTDDGGEDWTRCYLNDREGVFFNALDFWDEKRGIAVGDPIDGRFTLIRTADGGRNWTPVTEEDRPQALAGEAMFAASGTCLTVWGEETAWFITGGGAARVHWSSDGGTTWQVSGTPFRPVASSMGLFSVAFRNDKDGLIVGGDYTKPYAAAQNALITSDGGHTWQGFGLAGPSGYRSVVAFVPVNGWQLVLAVGKGGADLSRDGGLTWLPSELPGAYALSFAPGTGTGWMTGAEGKIVRIDVD